MSYRMIHMNINVMDLEKSLHFYQEALGLQLVRRKEAADGSFVLLYLTDEEGRFQLELTWLRDRHEAYDLADNEIHLAVSTDNLEASLQKHQAMGCVAMENPKMGIYFIEDPDGYWVEIVPEKK